MSVNNESFAPYTHDVAEEVAWAQKQFIDIAVLALQGAAEVERIVIADSNLTSTAAYEVAVPRVAAEFVDMPLTTTQAAAKLGVSRPHLINKLLNTGEIGFHKTGRDRRIMLSDVISYNENRRQQALDRLKK